MTRWATLKRHKVRELTRALSRPHRQTALRALQPGTPPPSVHTGEEPVTVSDSETTTTIDAAGPPISQDGGQEEMGNVVGAKDARIGGVKPGSCLVLRKPCLDLGLFRRSVKPSPAPHPFLVRRQSVKLLESGSTATVAPFLARFDAISVLEF
ncbi:hypothetical protein Cgig2_018414 [Carnegiea gigantea]|uniref:Uncharacterized protein n=1 Tax=Carnegiea gigantea TaxID=171969 RepID=A0A9Q1JTC7_9CARY|nr:hypothetical protein Cgig2_018414 [Carnegiea gigantea]